METYLMNVCDASCKQLLSNRKENSASAMHFVIAQLLSRIVIYTLN